MTSPASLFYHFSLHDCISPDGLAAIDRHFLVFLKERDQALCAQLEQYRDGEVWDAKRESDFLINLATHLQQYIGEGFAILPELEPLLEDSYRRNHLDQVARKWLQIVKFSQRTCAPDLISRSSWVGDLPDEETFLLRIEQIIGQEDHPDRSAMIGFSLWMQQENLVDDWSFFKAPQKKDYMQLLDLEEQDGQLRCERQHARSGFDFQDVSKDENKTQHEVNYCIYCHKNQGDFCSRGFPHKKSEPELGFKHNLLGETLAGCPLDQRISEMNQLRRDGHVLAALIMVMRDNPMCAATGHRICNDCMKACIYQKQDPVDVPQIESRILLSVLSLPYGAEIYQLLVWWNPLRQSRYVMSAPQAASVAIMGMGPSGFTMAREMLVRGYRVLGLDGVTLRPLADSAWLTEPVRDFAQMRQDLGKRLPGGFGGVAEYGITVRWDKNFLTLIRVLLERQSRFSMLFGVRFGGTLRVEDIWEMGYSHLVLAVGAGLPQALNIPGSLAPGMRAASDFLMNLQVTGAHLQNHRVNLDVRLPAVVVGGGLTGVDTATEVKAYYAQQIKSYAEKHRALSEEEAAIFAAQLTPVERQVSQEWLADYKRLTQGEDLPDVSIVYRRRIQDSPAYRKNHEELEKAMQEGIGYYQDLSPERVVCDEHGHVSSLRVNSPKGALTLAAKNIFVATGARPNIAYAYEHSQTFEKEKGYYVRYNHDGQKLVRDEGEHTMKSEHIGFFTSYAKDGRYVSLVGDAHPVFHGSVVGAIASSQRAALAIEKVLTEAQNEPVSINAPTVIDVAEDQEWAYISIQSPLHAKNALPGHLFRLELLKGAYGPQVLSLVEAKDGVLSFYVPKDFAKLLTHGMVVSLMGPSGVRMRIPSQPSAHVLVSDDGGVVDLIAIYKALIAKGNDVKWFHVGATEPWQRLCERHAIDWSSMAPESLAQACVEAQPERLIVMGDVSHVKAIASLRPQLGQCEVVASVKGAAQCLLKGICAQCLQWQVDPVTLERTKAVFACSWQNEPIELIDLEHLQQRQDQTRLWQKMSQFWHQHHGMHAESSS